MTIMEVCWESPRIVGRANIMKRLHLLPKYLRWSNLPSQIPYQVRDTLSTAKHSGLWSRMTVLGINDIK